MSWSPKVSGSRLTRIIVMIQSGHAADDQAERLRCTKLGAYAHLVSAATPLVRYGCVVCINLNVFSAPRSCGVLWSSFRPADADIWEVSGRCAMHHFILACRRTIAEGASGVDSDTPDLFKWRSFREITADFGTGENNQFYYCSYTSRSYLELFYIYSVFFVLICFVPSNCFLLISSRMS